MPKPLRCSLTAMPGAGLSGTVRLTHVRGVQGGWGRGCRAGPIPVCTLAPFKSEILEFLEIWLCRDGTTRVRGLVLSPWERPV